MTDPSLLSPDHSQINQFRLIRILVLVTWIPFVILVVEFPLLVLGIGLFGVTTSVLIGIDRFLSRFHRAIFPTIIGATWILIDLLVIRSSPFLGLVCLLGLMFPMTVILICNLNQAHRTAAVRWIVVKRWLVLIAVCFSVSITGWPTQLAFFIAEPTLEQIASDVRCGRKQQFPILAGIYEIENAYNSDGESVILEFNDRRVCFIKNPRMDWEADSLMDRQMNSDWILRNRD